MLAAWTLFAVAGRDRWAATPLIAGALLLAAAERPRIAGRGTRLLDAALVACLLVPVLQLIPLRPALRETIAPAAAAFDRTERIADPTASPATRPMSINPPATAWAVAVGAGLLFFFWSARTVLARGGVRLVARGIAWCGLVLAPLVIVQQYTAPRLLYWHWQPPVTNAYPYGPFVNRNDLACWLIMTIPLAAGYMIAHVESHLRPGNARAIENVVNGRVLWLGGSLALMTATLFITVSRSGLAGIAAAVCTMLWLSHGRLAPRRRAWAFAALAVIGVAAASLANLGLMASRVGDTLEAAGGRLGIWRQTWPMVRDFWPNGVGIGAFAQAMVLYHRGSYLFYVNHAHNQYLQLLAEGGAPAIGAAAIAVLSAARMILRRLAADRTALFWVRAGAASGLVAVAVQCVWETPLGLLANAVLFTLLAAIALHESDAHASEVSG
ncbi:MAG TPA: O-antigen ligase family protein [Vicinamibacterales bacterium]|nr:O-antigen ligase family protein [Vicinamibacterales bacterium]